MPSEVAGIGAPALSPSGRFRLLVTKHVMNKSDVLQFQIQSKDGAVVFTPIETFYARDATFFLWDDQDRVWVYSGDLGTFFWTNEGDVSNWKKHIYADENVPAPPYLKQVRPRFHLK